MLRFCGTDLWAHLVKLAKAREPKRMAIAYYSADSHVRFGGGDTLIVDASIKAIQSGQTSPTVLLAAARRGAHVYSHPRLHAKILLTGRCAIVGSANLSTTSRGLREAGVLLTNRRQLDDVARYLDWLKKEASRLSDGELRTLCKVPRAPSASRAAVGVKPSLLEGMR
ncbi:MAG: phospholipase D family protein [Chloroflexi bacterium]|nr:phospholipase D family protein [Chloroflexota bacterium]